MNECPIHHALLVLVMVALMVGGGLIQSGREPSPGRATGPVEANAAPRVTLIAASVSSCDGAH
jgi:hypothetical protein